MNMKWTSILFIGVFTVFLTSPSVNACVTDKDIQFEISSGELPSDANIYDFSCDHNTFQKKSWQKDKGGQKGKGLDISMGFPEDSVFGGIFKDLSLKTNKSKGFFPDAASFWYCDNASIDLIDLLTLLSNLDFDIMYEIDDSGKIVGTFTIGCKTYSFVISPTCVDDIPQVPIPGALLLLGSSIGACGLLKRRKA